MLTIVSSTLVPMLLHITGKAEYCAIGCINVQQKSRDMVGQRTGVCGFAGLSSSGGKVTATQCVPTAPDLDDSSVLATNKHIGPKSSKIERLRSNGAYHDYLIASVIHDHGLLSGFWTFSPSFLMWSLLAADGMEQTSNIIITRAMRLSSVSR